MLKGRKALITGASNGIGRAIALKLASLGCDIAINYYSDDKSAQKLVEDASKFGVCVYLIKVDMGNIHDIDYIAKQAIEKTGRIYTLINPKLSFTLDHTLCYSTSWGPALELF